MHNHFRFPKTTARHNFIYLKVRLNHRSNESQERLVSIWIDNTVNVPRCSHQNAKCICKMGPPLLFPLDFCAICANCCIKEINTTHSTIIYQGRYIRRTTIFIFSFCIGLVTQLNGSALGVLKHHYITKRIHEL